MSVRVMDPHADRDEGVPQSSELPMYIVSGVSKAPGSVHLSRVMPKVYSYKGWPATTDLQKDEPDLARGDTAPRLSMHPRNEFKTRTMLAAWRRWKLTSSSGRNCKPPKDFTIIVSIEDTGAYTLS